MKTRLLGSVIRCRRCANVYEWVRITCDCGKDHGSIVTPKLLSPMPAHAMVDGLDEWCPSCCTRDEIEALARQHRNQHTGSAAN